MKPYPLLISTHGNANEGIRNRRTLRGHHEVEVQPNGGMHEILEHRITERRAPPIAPQTGFGQHDISFQVVSLTG